jgi:hypothetical protein
LALRTHHLEFLPRIFVLSLLALWLFGGPDPAFSADPLVGICFLIELVSLNLLLLLLTFVGMDIRERGCVTFGGFIPWEDIASQEWKPANLGVANLQLKGRNKSLPFVIRTVRATQREQAERILGEHLPQAGS